MNVTVAEVPVAKVVEAIETRKLSTQLQTPSIHCKLNVKTCDLSNLEGIARKLIAPMLGKKTLKARKKLKLAVYNTMRTHDVQSFSVVRKGKLKKDEPAQFFVHSSRESNTWLIQAE